MRASRRGREPAQSHFASQVFGLEQVRYRGGEAFAEAFLHSIDAPAGVDDDKIILLCHPVKLAEQFCLISHKAIVRVQFWVLIPPRFPIIQTLLQERATKEGFYIGFQI